MNLHRSTGPSPTSFRAASTCGFCIAPGLLLLALAHSIPARTYVHTGHRDGPSPLPRRHGLTTPAGASPRSSCRSVAGRSEVRHKPLPGLATWERLSTYGISGCPTREATPSQAHAGEPQSQPGCAHRPRWPGKGGVMGCDGGGAASGVRAHVSGGAPVCWLWDCTGTVTTGRGHTTPR